MSWNQSWNAPKAKALGFRKRVIRDVVRKQKIARHKSWKKSAILKRNKKKDALRGESMKKKKKKKHISMLREVDGRRIFLFYLFFFHTKSELPECVNLAVSVWGDSNKSHNVVAAEWETSVLNESNKRPAAAPSPSKHPDAPTEPTTTPHNQGRFIKAIQALVLNFSKQNHKLYCTFSLRHHFIHPLFTLGMPTMRNRACIYITFKFNYKITEKKILNVQHFFFFFFAIKLPLDAFTVESIALNLPQTTWKIVNLITYKSKNAEVACFEVKFTNVH